MSHHCSGSCASCGGCAKQLTLHEGEIHILQTLGQIPFLPIARRADDMTPIYLEDDLYTTEQYSLTLQSLESKGLISLDYDQPLSRMDMSAYRGYPVHGSMALTQKGQTIVEMLERQGIQEE